MVIERTVCLPILWELSWVFGRLLEDGFTLVTTMPMADQIKENRILKSLDDKAHRILYYGLTSTEYNRISSCNTAKEIWAAFRNYL